MRIPSVLVPALGVLVAAGASPGSAQSGDLRLEATGSRSFPSEGAETVASNYLSGGLTAEWYSGPLGLFAAGYAGASTDAEGGDYVAGMGGVNLSGTLGPMGFGMTAVGTAFRLGEPFVYETVTGRVMPEVALQTGPVEVALTVEAGTGTTSVTLHRGDLFREASAHLWHRGIGGEVRVVAGRALLRLGAMTYETRRGDYDRAGASVSLLLPSGASVTGEIESWGTPLGDEVVGQVVVAVPIGRWYARASGGRGAPDPLLRTRAGGQGGMTLGRVLVDFSAQGPPEMVRFEPSNGGARATFSVRLEEAEAVELLGDFTGWEPRAMAREDGRWILELELPAGTHHFGFLVDGEWYVPEDAPGRVSDEWGQMNATVVVQ